MNSVLKWLKKNYQDGTPGAGKHLAEFYAREWADDERVYLHPQDIYSFQVNGDVAASWPIILPTRALYEPVEDTRVTILLTLEDAVTAYVERGPVESSKSIAQYDRTKRGWRMIWHEPYAGKWR